MRTILELIYLRGRVVKKSFQFRIKIGKIYDESNIHKRYFILN